MQNRIDNNTDPYYCGSMMTAQEMILELRESGMTQKQIAIAVVSNQPQIARIQEGQVPNYELGKKIERVYAEFKSDSAA